jgi:hypothetical protein
MAVTPNVTRAKPPGPGAARDKGHREKERKRERERVCVWLPKMAGDEG